jgi:hypothetical protein
MQDIEGNLVFIDLGVSNSPGGKIDVIENRLV